MNLSNENVNRFNIFALTWLMLSLCIMTFFWYEQKKENDDLKLHVQNQTSERQIQDSLVIVKLTNQIDSLNGEVFIQQTLNGRYELGLNFLKERKPNEYIVIKNYIDNLE